MTSEISNEGGSQPTIENSPLKQLTPDSLISSLKVIDKIISKSVSATNTDPLIHKSQEDLLQILIPWQAYLIHRGEQSDIDLSEEEVRDVIESTVLLLQAFQVDDIAGQQQGLGFNEVQIEHFHSGYGRLYSTEIPLLSRISSQDFFQNTELAYVFQKSDCDFRSETKQQMIEFLQQDNGTSKDFNNVIIQEEFDSLEAFETFRKSLPNDRPRTYINCRVKLGNDVGLWKVITPNGQIRDTPEHVTYSGEIYTITPVSKGDMWRSIMESGYVEGFQKKSFEQEVKSAKAYLLEYIRNISGSDTKQSVIDVLNIQEQFFNLTPTEYVLKVLEERRSDIDPARFNVLRKLEIAQKSSELHSSILQRHQHVFSQLFAYQENPSQFPQVHLTRSGISANSTAMLVAKHLVHRSENGPRVHMVDGWYEMENTPPKTWDTVPASDADILLVSVEPNMPQLKRNEKEFRTYRDEQISQFLAQARAKPDQHFTLIADVTADPLQHDFMRGLVRPNNVTIMRTASISKHQRGDRSHFFGLLAITGDTVEQNIINEAKRAVTGELTKDDLFAYPRLTRSELERNYEHVTELSHAFQIAMQKAQRYVPKAQRWVYQRYSYYGFLLPPQAKLYASRNNKKNLETLLESSQVKMAIKQYIFEHPNALIDKGDSFGLNTTRCVRFRMRIPIRRLNTEKEGEVIRFGFGLKTPKNEIKELAETIGELISN